jgi:hypothetical protein
MTLQGQESANQPTWAPNLDTRSAGASASASAGSGTGAVPGTGHHTPAGRKDSSDIHTPSGEAGIPNGLHPHGNGTKEGIHANGPSAAAQNGGQLKADASPFHLESDSIGKNNSGASALPTNDAPLAAPQQHVKLELGAADPSRADFKDSQAEAGPGPSTTANAVKRDYAAMSHNPLKRRKLEAAQYSEIEKLTHYAKEAE